MFFYISKILSFLIDPLFIFFSFTLLLLLKIKLQFRIKLVAYLVLISFYVVSSSIFADNLLYYLEHLAKPSELKESYDAVVVLSGMVDLSLSQENQIEFSSAVDRILKGIEIIKQKKANYIIISGGSGALIQRGKSEAPLLEKFAQNLGIDQSKIIIDKVSRNTEENAKETAKLIQKYQFKKILLVTSAFHMIRAEGCFKKYQINPDILPVDFNAKASIADFRDFLPSSQAIYRFHLVIREIIGIVVYGLTGKGQYL